MEGENRESINSKSSTITQPHYWKKIIIFVDGEKKSIVERPQTNNTRLSIEGMSRLIKVVMYSDKEFLLLATLLLDRSEIENSLSHRLFGWKWYGEILDTGERIIFAVSLVGAGLDNEYSIVDVGFQRNFFQYLLLLIRYVVTSFVAQLNCFRRLSPKR
ncbi:MAG: hypothetical protein AB1489_23165 [Acidobacteriota bacterium]